MRADGFVFSRRQQRWIVLAAVLSMLLLVVSYPVRLVIADDNEVIVSVEIVDVQTGESLSVGAVVIRSSSGTVQTIRHGRHATVEEGDFITVEAQLPDGYAFHHWAGIALPGGAKTTVALYNDSTVRLAAVSPPSESEDGSDDGDDADSGRRHASAPSAWNVPDDGTLEAAASRSPRSLTVIWVDFQNLGIEDGTSTNPFNTVAEGVSALVANAANTISFKAGVSQETITISTPMTLNAPSATARIGVSTFAVSHTLTTSVTGSGSVSGAGVYIEGSNATVNASASSGWAFSHWDGDHSGFVRPDTVLMDTNKSITAVFVQNPANLEVTTVTLSGGGALPTEARAGDTFTLEWTVLNDSGNTASSGDTNWADNVFLSRDNVFGAEDKALNVTGATVTGPIGAGNTYMASATITVPDASPGAYFLLVRTDTGAEVSHTASARAAGISANAIALIDPELTQ